MTHTYDWSKLDERWQFDGVDGLIDRKWDTRYSVTALLGGWATNRGLGSNIPAALDQLAKCRIPAPDMATVTELRPRDEYDWNNLGPYWWYDENKDALVYCSQDGKSAANFRVSYLERNLPITDMEKRAKEELKRCRIVKSPQSDEYDWSSLSPGWRFEADAKVLRHDEDWFRLATLESDIIPDDVYWQRAYVAARAQLAKCKRDWQDEVKQACDGLLGFTLSWYANSAKPRAELVWRYDSDSSVVIARAGRTIELSCNTESVEHLLTMSLIIERLKKLGWREA